MLARILSLPLIVHVIGLAALAMYVPAIHASVIDDHLSARVFFYSGTLLLILTAALSLAVANRTVRRQARSHLIALTSTFTLLPLLLAIPFYEAVRTTTFLNAYFEMVSSLTTTGATLFDPERLAPSVHLWRALVGWLGGFFIWVTAAAVLAPLNLGGFEVRGGLEIGQGASGVTPITRVADPSERLARFAAQFMPVYLFLTVSLWLGLYLAGDTPLVAICHAMAVMSTSGISSTGGPAAGGSGVYGEAIMLFFFAFALSRLTFAADERPDGFRSLLRDPEFRLGLLICVTLPVVFVLLRWLSSIEETGPTGLLVMLRSFWGALFTVTSFLTTTGFESAWWDDVRTWSGLDTPGLLLMGLAVFGGGVATTAGGVKLLRVFALYTHGRRELEKLVYPSSIGGSGVVMRQIRRQGAYVAWIFFMLFAMSLAAAIMAFAAFGIAFEDALVLATAALTTTGPLINSAGPETVQIAAQGGAVKLVFCVGMVVGRLETLALIALLNPEFWRS